jgi:acetylglutamate kinase
MRFPSREVPVGLDEQIVKAKVLVEALPYIRKFHGQTVVIKYGGSLMESGEPDTKFASDIVLLKYIGINPVVVHGGGKAISGWLNRLGMETKFIDGLRYTDADSMEVIEMVLSGKINSEIVNTINRFGGKAVGLSGKDAKLFLGRKITTKDGRDLGQVGEIAETDVSLINVLSERGYIPVISSVGVTPEGETLNMNADYVAAGIAGALKALKLIFMTDVRGIKCAGEFVSQITVRQADELLKHPDIKGGMVPKLEFAIHALRDGVRDVHIIDGGIDHSAILELFTDGGIGTMISNPDSGISNPATTKSAVAEGGK